MNNKTLALNSLNSALGNTRGIGEIGRAGTSRVKKENRVQENTKGKGEKSGVRELQGDRGRGGNRVARKHEGKREKSGAGELQGGMGKIRDAGTPRGVNKKEKGEEREIGWRENTKGKGEIRARENSKPRREKIEWCENTKGEKKKFGRTKTQR